MRDNYTKEDDKSKDIRTKYVAHVMHWMKKEKIRNAITGRIGEHRIARPEVHIRQIVKRLSAFERFHHRPDAVLAREESGLAKTRAPVNQDRIGCGALLAAVN